jgi:hypothetical protein
MERARQFLIDNPEVAVEIDTALRKKTADKVAAIAEEDENAAVASATAISAGAATASAAAAKAASASVASQVAEGKPPVASTRR